MSEPHLKKFQENLDSSNIFYIFAMFEQTCKLRKREEVKALYALTMGWKISVLCDTEVIINYSVNYRIL